MFWSCSKAQIAYTEKMDGFNVIPIQSETDKIIPVKPEVVVPNNTSFEKKVEKVTPAKNMSSGFLSGNFLFLISIFSFLGVFGYFFFLVFTWTQSLDQIGNLAQLMNQQKDKINKDELQDFINTDKVLKAINQRLASHTLNSEILNFMNANLRSNLQVTDYKIENKDREVELNITSISPSFKEISEQSSRLLILRSQGLINNFSFSNLSIESDGKKLRFTTKVTFDRSKVSALAFAKSINK